LWAEDEARLGLKPVMRRVWAPVGERPVARFKRGYKWTYLYGFVHPQSGKVFWMILPTVNAELYSLALEEFAREVGAGEDKHILLRTFGGGPSRVAHWRGGASSGRHPSGVLALGFPGATTGREAVAA
jgi:hypothetical protein